MLKICVTFFDNNNSFMKRYYMDHDDDAQRRVLGEQIYNAFRAGQSVTTFPVVD